MKQVIRLIPIVFLLAIQSIAAQQTHALLIGVGAYPANSGWSPLNVENDLAKLNAALNARGVADANIQLLLNQEASRQGIADAIQNLALRVAPGDVVYIHFSGHGQQIVDNNGDELDGLDEALIPIDAKKNWEKNGYQGAKHLRDDDLGKLLNTVRLQLSAEGHMLVSIDACHSGTATRGGATVRGTNVIMGDSTQLRSIIKKTTDNHIAEYTMDQNGAAPMVALFSAGQHELSYEVMDKSGKAAGAFSTMLSEVLGTADEHLSYKTLIDQISVRFNALSVAQTPHLSGNPDRIVLNGRLVPPATTAGIKEFIGSDLLVLDKGSVHGFTEGRPVKIFPSGVQDTIGVKPLATGLVDLSTPFDCDVLMDINSPLEIQQNARVWIDGRVGALKQAGIVVDLPEGSLKTWVLRNMKALGRFEEIPDGTSYRIGLSGAGLQLIAPDGQALYAAAVHGDSISRNDQGRLKAAMREHQKIGYLKGLDFGDLIVDCQLNLLPVNQSINTSNRPLRLNLNEVVQFQVENKGQKAFYYNILAITSEGELDAMLPSLHYSLVDYRLLPGEKQVTEIKIQFTDPGEVCFKVFATQRPLDLRGICIENSRSAVESGGLMGAILDDLLVANQNQSRGHQLPPGYGAVRTLLVQVVEE